jgi:hypothetical protein
MGAQAELGANGGVEDEKDDIGRAGEYGEGTGGAYKRVYR